jgi:D-lactate dehydrogenase
LKKVAPKKINEDVVVPVSALPTYIAYTHQLIQEYPVKIVNFGHAGNGNIHTNIMLDPTDPKQEQAGQICLEKIFTKVLSLHGTLSGEHGVGIDKRDYVANELDAVSLKLMHGIKNVFDPKGILNPGKVLPEG